jgi:hypothetical protein
LSRCNGSPIYGLGLGKIGEGRLHFCALYFAADSLFFEKGKFAAQYEGSLVYMIQNLTRIEQICQGLVGWSGGLVSGLRGNARLYLNERTCRLFQIFWLFPISFITTLISIKTLGEAIPALVCALAKRD